ncbi:MAG: hypothetical protein AMXMBFR7_51790 [Planctomycetota bacterium]
MTQPNVPSEPLPEDWMDEDLIRRTQEVWSEASGRIVSRAEALEILSNVKWLGRTLLAEVRRREAK